MTRTLINYLNYLVVAAALALAATTVSAAPAADGQIARGKYLVAIVGCSDCHTPGAFLGHPDMKRLLGGSEVGMVVPGLGIFVPRNLTPDKETGIGNWTVDQIVTTFTTGVRPDGRMLAPVMPWRDFALLTKSDAMAIAVYLKSLPPVKHAVVGPFGPIEKPTVMVMPIIPADVYMKMPKPGAPLSAPPK